MRKPITKKLRFEIFKRDNFTCQYCGRKAPDVILNVDHINPVKRGGKNDILNLITSCFECNSGKKARLLTDKSVIEKQQNQLEELNEKRVQMEMMIQWRNELQDIENNQIKFIIDTINGNLQGFYVDEDFKKTAKSLLKKYALSLILEVIDISSDRYLKTYSQRDSEIFIDKISGIAKNLSLPIIEQKINYMSGYLSSEYGKAFWQLKSLLTEYCNALKNSWNYSDKQIIADLENEVKKQGNQCYSFYEFSKVINGWIDDINN